MASNRLKTKEEKLALVNQYLSAGISKAEFCKRKKISPKSLTQWHEELFNSDRKAPHRNHGFVEIPTEILGIIPNPERTETAKFNPTAQIKLELGCGVILELKVMSQ